MILHLWSWMRKWSLLRFSLVGAACAALNIVLQLVCTGPLRLHYVLANLVSFAIMVPLSFTLHRHYTFQAVAGEAANSFLRYTGQWLLLLPINLLLMSLAVDVCQLSVARAIPLVSVLLYLGNYLGQRYWVFRWKAPH